MRFLLDTHTFIWMASDEGRLGRTARRRVTDPRTELHLSVASVWEMAIKASLGKLELRIPLRAFVESQLAATGVAMLGVSHDHALAVADLPFHHRDPFDRLLVAQALHERMTLLGADPSFDAYGVTREW